MRYATISFHGRQRCPDFGLHIDERMRTYSADSVRSVPCARGQQKHDLTRRSSEQEIRAAVKSRWSL